MEKILRNGLIVVGILMLILAVINFFVWVIGVAILQSSAHSYPLTFSFLSLINTALLTLRPAAPGLLCLYAAHTLSPLQNLFRKK